MNPSRSRSQGRLARAASSLRVERPRIAANPAIASGVIAASAPPQIIASAAPRPMIAKASPMACAPVVQAVAGADVGPFAPNRIDTYPAARFTIADGMKNGDTRDGPR